MADPANFWDWVSNELSPDASQDPQPKQAARTTGGKGKKAAEGTGMTPADRAAVAAANHQQRTDNLTALASLATTKPWNSYSPQEQAVASQLAQQMFGVKDISQLSKEQWTQLGAVAGERAGGAADQPETATDAWAVLSQGLANQLGTIQGDIAQEMSPQTLAAGDTAAQNQALAETGTAPGSAAANWLTANQAEATKMDQPMIDAMQAYSTAAGQGTAAINQAITN